jgi:hypothetical protein
MVPEPPRLPTLSRALTLGAFALLLVLLASHAAWRLRSRDQSLYEVVNDYPVLALGHGINLDFWKEDFPARRVAGYAQTTHPGLPFQVASGLAYQVAHAPGKNARERALRTLADPGRFWTANRVLAAALFLGSICLAFAATWKGFGALSLIVPLATLAYAPSWTYGLGFLGNETFALLLFLALWLSVRTALGTSVRPAAYLLVGLVGGACYLNKLNYVAWLAGAALALVYFAVRTPSSTARKLAALAALAAGTAISIAGIGVAFLGRSGFGAMLALHGQVFWKSGYYGEGDPGVVKASLAWSNLRTFVGENAVFAAWLAAVIALLVLACFQAWRHRDFQPADRAMALFLGTSFALALLAALKHYWPHYVIPAVVVVPFAALSLGRRLPRAIATGMVVVTLLVALRVALAERRSIAEEQAVLREYQAEVRRARELPLGPGGLRIWTYKARAPEYGVSFAIDNSTHPELYDPFYQAGFPSDRGVFRDYRAWPSWEYVVLTKRYFPSPSDVPAELAASADVVVNGRHLLVLRRRSP